MLADYVDAAANPVMPLSVPCVIVVDPDEDHVIADDNATVDVMADSDPALA